MLAIRILVAPGARTMMSNSSARYLTRPLISLPFQNGTISPIAPVNKRYSTDPVKNSTDNLYKNVVLDPAESAWSRFLFRRFKSTYDSDITAEFKEGYLDRLPNDHTFQIPRNLFNELQGKYSQLREQYEALSVKYEVVRDERKEKEIQLVNHGYLKWLNWIRVVIDRFETNHGMVNVKLDWTLINKISEKIEKSKEIRRQRWVHILTNETAYPEVNDLLDTLKKRGISVDEFAKDIAEGYDFVSDTIKSVIRVAGLGPYVTTENKFVNRSLEILIENLETNVEEKINCLK